MNAAAFNFFNKNKPQDSKTILIVDDSPVDREMISSFVKKAAHKAETAQNGEEGLKKARELKPDLILLDCQMPVMGGLEMCKRLKEDDTLKNIPVIFLTAIDTPKNIIDCFDVDAENYLSKPISARVLLTQIKLILNNPAAAQ